LSKPEILIIISPHGELLNDSFTLNVCSKFDVSLKDFGDLTTHFNFKGEMNLSSRIQEQAKKENFSVTLLSEKIVDYGVAVPLFYLHSHLPQLAVLPIGFSGKDWKTHLDFGYFIKEQIMNNDKRIAVIASGDLSHALTTDSPGGFNAAGEQFDTKIQDLLATKNSSGLLQLPPELIEDAQTCGFKTFLILLGILRGINCTYKSYCYEAPFGVGYLTANFVL
jgi:AmmeMemoRadiSam system protein B